MENKINLCLVNEKSTKVIEFRSLTMSEIRSKHSFEAEGRSYVGPFVSVLIQTEDPTVAVDIHLSRQQTLKLRRYLDALLT